MSRMQRTGEVEAFVAASRVVVPARRERDAEHGDRRIDCLQRVVGLPEDPRVRGACETGAPGAELRLPEARLVRLVADSNVLHLAVGARDLGDEGDELVRRRGGAEERACPAGRDHDRESNPRRRRVRDVAVERGLVPDRRRVVGIPREGDAVLGQPDVLHRREEGRTAVLGQLSAVVRHADAHVCGGRRREQERSAGAGNHRGCLSSKPHHSSGKRNQSCTTFRTASSRVSAPNRTGSSVGSPVSSATFEISMRASSSSRPPVWSATAATLAGRSWSDMRS